MRFWSPFSIYSRLDLSLGTIDEHDHLLDTKLFHYTSWQKDVPQLSRRNATRADTNVPLSGALGLPRYRNADITRWRVVTSWDRDHVVDLFSETTAALSIRDCIIATTTLHDLVSAPVTMTLPAQLGELEEYHVDVACHHENAWHRFRSWARNIHRSFSLWVYLEGNIKKP